MYICKIFSVFIEDFRPGTFHIQKIMNVALNFRTGLLQSATPPTATAKAKGKLRRIASFHFISLRFLVSFFLTFLRAVNMQQKCDNQI